MAASRPPRACRAGTGQGTSRNGHLGASRRGSTLGRGRQTWWWWWRRRKEGQRRSLKTKEERSRSKAPPNPSSSLSDSLAAFLFRISRPRLRSVIQTCRRRWERSNERARLEKRARGGKKVVGSEQERRGERCETSDGELKKEKTNSFFSASTCTSLSDFTMLLVLPTFAPSIPV